MRIDSITLKNIKAHADFSAEFLPGINFIGGRNGAGKTTIIESIGLALFGYPPKDIKEYFLKYGEKQGEITIRFTVGSDTYSVVRKIGTADTRRIFQNGAELDIEHRTDFNAFMRELLGLPPSEDLAQLFATIIGVPQGCLTQSFLQQPAARKSEFNSVLKVDSYRVAADKGRSIKNYIADQKGSLQVDIARYQGELMRLEPLREAIIQKASELDALKIKVGDLEVQKQKAQCAAEGFRAQKLASDKAKADMSSAEAAKRTIEAEYKAIVLRYQDALEAVRVLETSREGYDSHIAAEKEKKGLEQKRSAREALVRKYHALMQKAGFILEATDEEKADLTERSDQNEARLITLQTQTGKLRADMMFEPYPNVQRAAGGVLGRLGDTLDQLGAALEDKRERILRNSDDFKAMDKEITALKARAAADIVLLHQAGNGCCPVTEMPCDKLDFDEAALAGCEHIYTILDGNEKRLGEAADKLSALQLVYASVNDQLLQDKQRFLGLDEKYADAAKISADAAEIAGELEQYSDFDRRFETLNQVIAQTADAFRRFEQHVVIASGKDKLEAEVQLKKRALDEAVSRADRLRREYETLTAQFDETAYEAALQAEKQMHAALGGARAELDAHTREYEKLLDEKTQLEKTAEKELTLQAELEEQSEIENFTIQVLNLLKNAGEQVAQVYRAKLSQRAEAIYRQITSEPVRLEWTEDYDIRLSDIYDKAERIRAFKQLSGGEQMAAALAVRLGLIEFSRLKLAFFDESTSNLDAVRRSSLADMFQRIPGELEQIFIISHDDTFDTITQNVILL